MSKRNRRTEKRMKQERREKAALANSQHLPASSTPVIKISKNRQRQAEAVREKQGSEMFDPSRIGLPDTGMAAAFVKAGI